MSSWSLLVLSGAAGIVLGLLLSASADARPEPSAHGAAESSFPLVVRHANARMTGGQIVASATIVNTQTARVRSTTGALGLISGHGGAITGVRTFAVPSLPGHGSRTVRFTTGRLRGLPLPPGTADVVLCTDVASQIRRFSSDRNCARVGSVAIGAAAVREGSGPVPNTIIRKAPLAAGNGSTAVFAFGSTVAGGVFQCSLDGGPWFACSSARRYTALVAGRHMFAVRAISPAARPDPTPARVAWTVGAGGPTVTLQSPVNGSTTSDATPAFSGTAGTAATDASKVTVKVFSGSRAAGSPVQTLTTTRSGGSWSVAAVKPIADGIYTVQAEQSNVAGNVGVSAPSTFTIQASSPSRSPAPSPVPRPTPTPGPGPGPGPAAFSVGGTVSGLSGTVGLEDNGGDDLNVAGNGPFTFVTKLPAGGAYQVTVASSPSGQVCTVSGGSGTVGSADVTTVAVTCVPAMTQLGEDDFDRADGALGTDWTAIADDPLSIASGLVVGRPAPVYAGEIRSAAGESYGSDQYSQVELISNSVGPGNGDFGSWVGPMVRSQPGGRSAYVGLYFWNNGAPELRIDLRSGDVDVTPALGTYNCGLLPAGTQLTLTAFGSTISLAVNGVVRIQVNDTTLTGGAPGIMTFDAATAENWSGGNVAESPPAP